MTVAWLKGGNCLGGSSRTTRNASARLVVSHVPPKPPPRSLVVLTNGQPDLSQEHRSIARVHCPWDSADFDSRVRLSAKAHGTRTPTSFERREMRRRHLPSSSTISGWMVMHLLPRYDLTRGQSFMCLKPTRLLDNQSLCPSSVGCAPSTTYGTGWHLRTTPP